MGKDATTRLTRSEGRRFALTLAGAFAAIALFMLWREREFAARIIAGLSAVLAAAGLFVPTHLGPIERGWMRFGVLLSRITSPIFLGIVYFAVFMPAGLLRRTFGGKMMLHTPANDSYWKVREPTGAKARRESMERQF